jgi:hypothetical protein
VRENRHLTREHQNLRTTGSCEGTSEQENKTGTAICVLNLAYNLRYLLILLRWLSNQSVNKFLTLGTMLQLKRNCAPYYRRRWSPSRRCNMTGFVQQEQLMKKVDILLHGFIHILVTLTPQLFYSGVCCNVGDWVEVKCDYSPGTCSEGGTGVVIAKVEGNLPYTFYTIAIPPNWSDITGLVTVKYIYGPANTSAVDDAVIGSSISGRLESKIGLDRLTTIAMPMKGTPIFHL